jgi:hypothetical protein
MPKKPQKPPAASVQLETLLKASALRRLQQEPAGPRAAAKPKTRAKKASKS